MVKYNLSFFYKGIFMQAKKIIMLVEDEEVIARETIEIINRIKDSNNVSLYDVVWAKNGVQALKLRKKHDRFFGLLQNKIECILLDLRMPIMDGQQFFLKLRQIEKRRLFSRLTPVIFLTAYEDDEKWATAIEGMATEYIQKPLEESRLRSIMNSIFENMDNEILIENVRQKGLQKREKYAQEIQYSISFTGHEIDNGFLSKLTTKQILLIENDEKIGKEISTMLSEIRNQQGHSKYTVLWAKDGEEAQEILQVNKLFLGFAPNKIHCILLNIQIPDMNGVQFINRLREAEERKLFGRFIPVILFTDIDDALTWEVAIHNWISDVLIKPISKVKLEAALKRLFEDWDPESLIELTKSLGKKKLQELDRKKLAAIIN